MLAPKGKVVLHHFGPLTENDGKLPTDWPSGDFLLDMMAKQGFNGKELGDSLYWQAFARWALLSKFSLSPLKEKSYKIDETTRTRTRRLDLSTKDIEAIMSAWDSLIETQSTEAADLVDLLTTSKSNGRSLKWTFLECGPACQFRLHAHPNLELVYCVKGSLHEVRMDGKPFQREYSSKEKVSGPNLTSLDRSWSFGTLHEGEWLVNEPGSIHKSFTATNSEGCVLLVLWGGAHADIIPGQEPTLVDVPMAVNKMDEKLSNCHCSKWDTISETFLPSSERTS